MKYETIKDCGEFGIEFDNIRGPGSRVSREFLRRFLKQFVLRSTEYYDETGDHAFYYRERQLHSVVCPSIAHITPTFLMEHPLTRKPAGEEERPGRVDYWIHYKNYSFLMELKHAYFAYSRAHNPGKSVTKKFTKALKQLRNVRKGECRFLKFGDGLRKIALEAIVFYRRWKEENKLKADLERYDFKSLFQELIENTELEHKSNLRALWVLDKKLVEPVKITSLHSFEIFPATAFVGSIWEIIE